MLRTQGVPDDEREQWIESQREFMEDAPEFPPLEVLLEVFGDVVSEMRSTPEGFMGRTMVLEADEWIRRLSR